MKQRFAPFLELVRGWPESIGSAEKLPGDASDREFYRLRSDEAGSAVLMVLTEPYEGEELPFINILNHLASRGVRVPALYSYDEKRGLLLLEDAGDFTLQEELQGKGDGVYRRYYRMAIDELVKIHYDGDRSDGRHCVAFDIRFTAEKFMWELDFFMEHTLKGYMGFIIDPDDETSLRKFFSSLCASIAGLPTVLTHRDYHARNLLVRNNRLVVVDFQDARLGPCQYDLASLLRDSYVVLNGNMRNDLVDYYISQKEKKEARSVDRSSFMAYLDRVTVQRCLKAAGTFGYMSVVKGNDSYLKYLQPAFVNVRDIVAANEDLTPLRDILFRYIDKRG